MSKVYLVSELATLAGVSRRTLHHYDSLGLLVARRNTENNYRYYTEEDLMKLQQIMFYRELDYELGEIKPLLEAPHFSVLNSLKNHKNTLLQKAGQLQELIQTVDQTINHLERKTPMSTHKLFEGFSEEKQEAYAKEAAERWDSKVVAESQKKWKNYTKDKKEAIKAETGANYERLAALMSEPVESDAVQAEIAIWHENLRNFYEPTPEMLRGLGDLYVQDPRFNETIDRVAVGLSEFLQKSIAYYCDTRF